MYVDTVESLPDTTITFTNGKKIVVLEKEEEMVEAIIQFYRTVNILGFRNDVEENHEKSLLSIMLIIFVAITLVGVIAFVVVTKLSDPTSAEEKPSIDEIVKSSVEIPEITTNLAGNDYIKISFMVQTENKKAKEELEKEVFK